METRLFTRQETDFVIRQLPNPPYRTILDICCGQGRHANILADTGYDVVGVDADSEALAVAQSSSVAPVNYVCNDIRRLREIDGIFDAAMLLWQSFGYFDQATNEDILIMVSEKLRPKGRFILDIYNRNYWEQNQGDSQFERNGTRIHTTSAMRGNRLSCHLRYDGGESETFDWQLYSLDEIVYLAEQCRLSCLLSCTESDEGKPVSDVNSQMQIVFEKQTY